MVPALLFCVSVQRPVWIWSDCLGVVRKVRRFLDGPWLPAECTRHSDLWKILVPYQETLECFCKVCKVTAHLEPDLETGAGNAWCAFYTTIRWIGLRNELKTPVARLFGVTGISLAGVGRGRERFLAAEVIALHVRVGHLATRSRVSRTNMELQPLPPPDWTGTLGVLDEANERFLAWKYGRDYVQDLLTWSRLLDDDTAPVRWISSVQLFFSCCMRFRRPPVFRNKEWQD